MVLLALKYKLNSVCNAENIPHTVWTDCISHMGTHKNQLQGQFSTIYCFSQAINTIYSILTFFI